ncbi:hypothetical protein [Pedobacter sp. SYSU D00535]|uniref:hypothetical protein n=1 Tax=Pedobacter sp. SYSU D00535 TaxID=2810308 RepID=UPI001A973F1B|nr:hypothetical protein [Pedobacter sp. SYSU D00535]
MRNFVPALEETLMKFTPAEITRDQPEARYAAHGGWFGVESIVFDANKKKISTRNKKAKKS